MTMTAHCAGASVNHHWHLRSSAKTPLAAKRTVIFQTTSNSMPELCDMSNAPLTLGCLHSWPCPLRWWPPPSWTRHLQIVPDQLIATQVIVPPLSYHHSSVTSDWNLNEFLSSTVVHHLKRAVPWSSFLCHHSLNHCSLSMTSLLLHPHFVVWCCVNVHCHGACTLAVQCSAVLYCAVVATVD